jgi:Uma2 family endonuclease
VSLVHQTVRPLVDGERLSREEFLRRWELLPEVKRAELLEGVVYMPSPVGAKHDGREFQVYYWLGHYTVFTPGCSGGSNGTWLMTEDSAPQPDGTLRLLPEVGGQAGEERGLHAGAPELIVEVSASSASRDLGTKLRLYQKSGVREYITVLVKEEKVVWRRLERGKYVTIEPGADGILRSVVFPGLWLDPDALLRGDAQRMLAVLTQGLESEEHAAFVADLESRRKKPSTS